VVAATGKLGLPAEDDFESIIDQRSRLFKMRDEVTLDDQQTKAQALGKAEVESSIKERLGMKTLSDRMKDLDKGFKETMGDIFPTAPGLGGKMGQFATGAMGVAGAMQGGGGWQGGLSGAMSGGTAGAAFGPYGAAIGAVVGGVLGFIGKKESKETEHQTLQIASRIDVTNKQLEIANRNLSAMRRAFEGWGQMPQSAYFSESMGMERRFALSSMRGYYG
jgi:hypothetical protein